VQPVQVPIKNIGPMVLPQQNNQNNTAKKDIDWFSPSANQPQPVGSNNPLNTKALGGAVQVPVA